MGRKNLGPDQSCRYKTDDPRGVGIRCRVDGIIKSNGACTEGRVRTITDKNMYLIVLDGGAVRVASGSELEV